VSVKTVRWKGWGLWWERFKEKVSFEFRVEKSRSDGQWKCAVVSPQYAELARFVNKAECFVSALLHSSKPSIVTKAVQTTVIQ